MSIQAALVLLIVLSLCIRVTITRSERRLVRKYSPFSGNVAYEYEYHAHVWHLNRFAALVLTLVLGYTVL